MLRVGEHGCRTALALQQSNKTEVMSNKEKCREMVPCSKPLLLLTGAGME